MTARDAGIRLAMWSGPRNISTTLMRAWDSRCDTYVTDEPLYAHYLDATGLEHPGRDEILGTCQTDWIKVAAWLTGPIPNGAAIWYQKHMTHHLLPTMDRSWLDKLSNCFLIRDPREVLLSYGKVMPGTVTPEAVGFPQQLDLFEYLRDRHGTTPPVLDARDVLERPAEMMEALCKKVGISYCGCSLEWDSGRRDTDGIWARYWYKNVNESTGFIPYRPREGELAPELEDVLAQCLPAYETLYRERLRPTVGLTFPGQKLCE